ncbi:type I-F CRISPR-associated endoribonuclease Cas6/Csy4 [Enterobacter sp. RHBSTW-00994]|uniref:type I-F CRISPR-associated endoribonuclease Cas6/Csy4 n=1 Tax=Enterobacteriaceae TaxID=543 RepID=UPI0015EA2F3E|nr:MULTISPECIES: type I-F CRISPR-associated endoribonuclease Cas6/Csy4 [Enterobacteriaceae]MBM3073586.1 type I-F CRISPR-associated endoribonuclease Cas6/Csy4 [Lelliottia sp. RWM.1]QLR42508.1 type I-F CRISPR-associated endoribonuclease Cas6/Csy4 [Enterobacter sp. RHBSTW-00994]
MDHYLEIRLLPDPEFSEEVLMAALFAKLHRALVQRGKGDIGVSFPLHDLKPGAILRLHGYLHALHELESMVWRKGLSDYCQCTEILSVPSMTVWRCVSRVQVKSSPQRLLRRSVRKGWLTEEEAKERALTTEAGYTDLPWINMRSLSTGQSFRLFIRHGDCLAEPVSGVFSSYGLSAGATIPWF